MQVEFERQQEIGEATRVHQANEIIDKPYRRWMQFGLSPSRNEGIEKLLGLELERQQEIGGTTRVHRGNEVLTNP